MADKLSPRARLYLEAVNDWKADYEVAAALGDDPAPAPRTVRSVLGRLIGRGLVTWSKQQNTYQISPAGRSALANQ